MLGDLGDVSDDAGAKFTVNGGERELVFADAVVPTMLL